MSIYTCYGGVSSKDRSQGDAVLVLLKDSKNEEPSAARIVIGAGSGEGTGLSVLVELTTAEAEQVRCALAQALDAIRAG